MGKKLTLNLDQSIIEKAKAYAKKNQISLSKLIEAYLSSLTSKTKSEKEITPLVKSLSGVIELPSDAQTKDAYSDFLADKYK